MQNVGENEPCYLLHRRPYRESSFLVDIFSLNYGRSTLLAKGAAASKQQSVSALLQPFQPLVLGWKGKSSLKTLIQIEAPSSPFRYKNDALYCAYYLNELVLNLLPDGEANSRVFAWYAEALERLVLEQPNELALRHFEYCFLCDIGQLPDFSLDHRGSDILPDRIYGYLPEEGFMEDDRYRYGGIHVRGESILALMEHRFLHTKMSEETVSVQVRKEAKVLMRFFVDLAMNGKELKSRKMFTQLKQSI